MTLATRHKSFAAEGAGSLVQGRATGFVAALFGAISLPREVRFEFFAANRASFFEEPCVVVARLFVSAQPGVVSARYGAIFLIVGVGRETLATVGAFFLRLVIRRGFFSARRRAIFLYQAFGKKFLAAGFADAFFLGVFALVGAINLSRRPRKSFSANGADVGVARSLVFCLHAAGPYPAAFVGAIFLLPRLRLNFFAADITKLFHCFEPSEAKNDLPCTKYRRI